MSLYIDHKYINLLSTRLQRFTKKSKNLYNFRCPVCGDSKKNSYKARGYLFNKKNKLVYKCHNCGAGGSLKWLLDRLDVSLSKQYSFEKYKVENNDTVVQIEDKIPVFRKPVFKKTGLPTINSLDKDHPAVKYLDARLIPKVRYHDIYYTDCFKSWVTKYDVNLASRIREKDERIIIPFFDSNKKLVAAQGRSITNSSLKYFTIKIDKEAPKIFGLDRWQDNELTYIVEGPIDSMFLPNALAMAGSDIDDTSLFFGKNVVYVYDNERRNKEIVEKMYKVVQKGFAICVWPDKIKFKDINDMVIGGLDIMDIIDIINKSTYRGLEARLKLNQWKRV